jgi:hypothetical protein
MEWARKKRPNDGIKAYVGYHDDRDNILLDERSDDVKVLKAFRVSKQLR